MHRGDGRGEADLRPIAIERNYLSHPEGSCLISFGRTRVLCTATVEEGVPRFLKGQGKGWLSAEYGMLPRSTTTRSMRDAVRGRTSGRTSEIQRLIGRALRAVTDLDSFGERTVWIDCDVLQADGGTRTASITGGLVALYDACRWMLEEGIAQKIAVREFVGAVSVGMVRGTALLDLAYEEDSAADVDMNIVMTENDEFVEIQGSAEGIPFTGDQLSELIDLARQGIRTLIQSQRRALDVTGTMVWKFPAEDSR